MGDAALAGIERLPAGASCLRDRAAMTALRLRIRRASDDRERTRTGFAQRSSAARRQKHEGSAHHLRTKPLSTEQYHPSSHSVSAGTLPNTPLHLERGEASRGACCLAAVASRRARRPCRAMQSAIDDAVFSRHENRDRGASSELKSYRLKWPQRSFPRIQERGIAVVRCPPAKTSYCLG